MRLLLVEDDTLIGDGLKKSLAEEKFTVDWVQSKEDATDACAANPYDVIVLDIRLPDGSGLDVLTELRNAANRTPVLLLTALDATSDRIRGLDSGADDYLVKPFEVKELCARIRALHRRSLGIARAQLVVNGIALDPASHTLSRDGEIIDLGAREFSILKILFERVDQVVTKDDLEGALYAWGDEVSSNAIEVLVHRIRKKLGAHIIKTIRGVGYITQTAGTSG